MNTLIKPAIFLSFTLMMVSACANASGGIALGATRVIYPAEAKQTSLAITNSNKKERYFRLTESGEALNRRHEALHNDIYARDEAVFATLSDAELNQMLAFAQTLTAHFDERLQQAKD